MTSTDSLVSTLRSRARPQLQALANRTAVVGFSGGPDSTCLLHVLLQLRDELKIELVAAHFDHQLHADSAAHADRAVGVANSLGVRVVMGRRTGEQLQGRGASEAAARGARYNFLTSVARELGAVVAVGHNLDDQAETVLLHLARGTGLVGLGGMRAVSVVEGAPDITLIRPLLPVRSSKVRQYCARHRLVTVHDPTNQSLELSRNVVRHHVVPQLEAVNARAVAHIATVADTVRAEDGYLEETAGRVFERVAETDGASLRIKRAALAAEHPVLLARVLRCALRSVRGSLAGIERVHVEALTELLAKGEGRALDLPGIRAHNASGWLIMSPTTNHGDAVYALPLMSAHSGERDEWLLRVGQARCVAPGRPLRPGMHEHIRHSSGRFQMSRWHRGQTFRPIGLAGTKPIPHFLAGVKVPRQVRERVPVVTCEDEVVMIVGWRLDDRWRRVDDGTCTCLYIESAAATAGMTQPTALPSASN